MTSKGFHSSRNMSMTKNRISEYVQTLPSRRMGDYSEEHAQSIFAIERIAYYTILGGILLFLSGIIFLSIGFGRKLFFFTKEACNKIVNVPRNFSCHEKWQSGDLWPEINYGGQGDCCRAIPTNSSSARISCEWICEDDTRIQPMGWTSIFFLGSGIIVMIIGYAYLFIRKRAIQKREHTRKRMNLYVRNSQRFE